MQAKVVLVYLQRNYKIELIQVLTAKSYRYKYLDSTLFDNNDNGNTHKFLEY